MFIVFGFQKVLQISYFLKKNCSKSNNFKVSKFSIQKKLKKSVATLKVATYICDRKFFHLKKPEKQ